MNIPSSDGTSSTSVPKLSLQKRLNLASAASEIPTDKYCVISFFSSYFFTMSPPKSSSLTNKQITNKAVLSVPQNKGACPQGRFRKAAAVTTAPRVEGRRPLSYGYYTIIKSFFQSLSTFCRNKISQPLGPAAFGYVCESVGQTKMY